MNKSELIAELGNRFGYVDEDGINDQGKTEAGLKVWGISVFEKTGEVIRKLNLTFYTTVDETEAYWGNAEPNPTPIIPEPTFTDRVNAFIASKIAAAVIKFGYIEQISELTQKALCAAIMPDDTEKKVLVSEDAEGVFTLDPL